MTAESASKDQDILRKGVERFTKAEEAEANNRATFDDDIKFSNGEQWPEAILNERKNDRRPALTINKVPAFVRQVTNDARQMRPAIKIKGVDSGADPDTANALNGMIRAIEQESNAEAAYDWGVEYAVRGGWGYWRVDTDYVDGDGFEQKIEINRVRNVLSCYLDPSAEQADGSDANWGFIVEYRDKDVFKEQYPDCDTEWTAGSDATKDWFTDDKIRVAEYYEIEKEKTTQVLLSDGQKMYEEELQQAFFSLQTAGIVPVAERKVDKCTLVHRLMTANKILETTRYPGRSYVPIVRVVGEELWIDGEILYQGMVKDMKDPQRQYNYWRTASAERGALSTKSPWIGPEGSFADPKWRNANTQNYSFLEYVPVTTGDKPWREQGLDVSSAFVHEVQQSGEDLKAVTGIYDPALGQQSNEISGVAIKSRKEESDVSNYHFMDNLGRAMRYTGKILVELIPIIYNDERVVTILGEDGTEEKVQLNQPFVDEKGKERMIDLKKGRYDVAIDIGPSYSTQREEAAASMMDLLKVFPEASTVIGDLVAQNMSWPQAEEISKRLKSLLPPAVAQGENPQIQQMVAQKDQEIQMMQQQMQQVTQVAQELQQELMNRQQEYEYKLAELEEKARANDQKHTQQMTKLEIDAGEDLPKGELYPDGQQRARTNTYP